MPAVLTAASLPHGGHDATRRVRGSAAREPIGCCERPRAQAAPRADPRRGAGRSTLLERLDEELPPLWLYGAGHVGQALARILAELPLRLTWIDSRADAVSAADSRRRADACMAADPVAERSRRRRPATRFLVLTHSHALDYALCRAILERGDFASLGLIGSKSKAARFRSRLARDGVAAASIARLVCPIGIGGIASKWPAAIAVAVAAQLLQASSARASAADDPACAAPPADAACEARQLRELPREPTAR